jgi:AcrR family transcriptional regulator
VPRVPREKDKIDKIRETILDYALDIICDEGYENFTMRELGNRLGCAAKTIYNYYSCKEDIYLRVLIKGFKVLNSSADAVLNGVTDPVEKLRLLCNVYIRFGLENVHYYNLMFSGDLPKYTSYLGTYFESAAREEKETAMYYAVISEAAISEILKKKGKDLKNERAYHLVRMWSTLHGYVSLHNSRSFPEYHSNTLKFQKQIVDNLLAGLK